MVRMHVRRPAPATLLALLALFVALGGPAEAARLIDGKKIRKGSVTGRAIKDRSLGVRELTPAARASLRARADGSVTAAKLAEGAVGASKLARDAVRSEHVLDGSLGAPDLGSDSVGADEVATNAVGADEIQPNAVRATEIADNSIDGGEVVDGGLQARDVGSFSGTLTVDPAGLTAGVCEAFTRAVAPNAPSQDIDDDVIALSPAAGWPDGYTLTARPSGPAEIRVVVCRVGGSIGDAPPVDVRYVSFDL